MVRFIGNIVVKNNSPLNCRVFFAAFWALAIVLASIFLPVKVFANLDAMPVDAAFQLSSSLREDGIVILHFKIAPEHYLYEKKFQFQIKKPQDAQFGQILMPRAQEKDLTFGKQKVYTGSLNISLPILNWKKNKLSLKVNYQGCSSSGYCYPPVERLVIFKSNATPIGEIKHIDQEPSNRAFAWLSEQPIWLIPLGFIGFGLLLSLTPCTFPMIPILSSIILGYRGRLTTTKAFALSLTYVTSMAVVYALIGILAGFLGNNFQMLFQKSWIIILFSSLFILLAFCSFTGFYKLKLPNFMEKHILKLSHKQKSGTYIGVAIMGALSTLIVSPCVTAPLIGVISFISQTGEASLGGIALFFMGLGMGFPLLLIGTLEARWIPKSGHWTHTIEIILGFLLLGIAINLLSKILPAHFILSLWGALTLTAAFYIGNFFDGAKIKVKTFQRGFAIILGVYGLSLILGGLMGSDDFFAPLKRSIAKVNNKEMPAVFKVVTTLQDLKKELNDAKNKGQTTLIDVYATWCAYCKFMDKTLFHDPEILGKINHFNRIKVDITRADNESKALLKYLNVVAPPVILFFDPSGEEIKNTRLVGEIKKEDF